ncbi:MAG: GTP 3',8-cyclase MoaA [Promethearchaeota archaeon]
MIDPYNRKIKHIRFSITSECNYNCCYCDNEGFVPKTPNLSVEEITKLCKILAEVLKVTRIKFTGGEPLCRKEVVQIIKNVSDLQLYQDISMTTNGFLLYEKVEELYDAGLNRINVSLSSLKPKVYERICGVNSLDKVLKGLNKAKETGLSPIKLNFVILKGINDNELGDMINFCAKEGFILQLIELHEISKSVVDKNGFYEKFHYDIKPLIKEFESKAKQIIIRGNMQNRKVFILPNDAVIETITPSHDFCKACTKLRVGCDGNLFGCLFRADLGENIRNALNDHKTLSDYKDIIKKVIDLREPYY